MPKGYWIGRVDVHDFEEYQGYLTHNSKAFSAYGAKFIVRGGQFSPLEGTSRSRNVVIEFPSYQAALDCYHSKAYQYAKSFRTPVSDADIIIIEGYDD